MVKVNLSALANDYNHPKVKSKIGLGTSLAPKGSAASFQPGGLPSTADPLTSDPLYQTAQAQQIRADSGADATALYQTNQINANYGYGADGSVDLTNPYSQAALMRDTYLNHRQGNTTSYAAQGQLYSGALQNAQDETTRQYGISTDQLAKARQAALDQVAATQAGTYGTAQSNTENQLAAALLRRTQGSS